MTRDQFLAELQSRADTQHELARDFGPTYALTRATERAKARKLFTQGAVATTNAPSLQNDATTPPPPEMIEAARNLPPPAERITPPIEKSASIAPRVDAWLEKNANLLMTDAQRRYPELLKVARPVPQIKRGKTAIPVRSGLSGGAA